MAVIREHGIYFLTGTLRSGKGLTAVSKIQEHLLDSRKVATNMDLKLEHLISPLNKTANVVRVPDQPTIEDLENIGLGYDHEDSEHYDESKFGLLVLDELATFLNSRSWNDKGRKAFIDWLLMSGKKRWILMLTIQDLELLDKQVKMTLSKQYIVKCKSLSKYSIPFFSPLYKIFTGRPLTLPKAYLGVVKIGTDRNASTNDRWVHYGSSLYSAYNTAQVYLDRDSINATQLSTVLPPFYTTGRYLPIKDRAYYRAKIRDHLEYLLIATLAALFFSFSSSAYSMYSFFTSDKKKIEVLNKKISKLELVAVEMLPEKSSFLKQDVLVCDESKKFLEGYHIEGSFQTGKSSHYLLTDGFNHHKTNELYEVGLRIISRGSCNLTILIKACEYNFNCDLPTSLDIVDDGDNIEGSNDSPLPESVVDSAVSGFF